MTFFWKSFFAFFLVFGTCIPISVAFAGTCVCTTNANDCQAVFLPVSSQTTDACTEVCKTNLANKFASSKFAEDIEGEILYQQCRQTHDTFVSNQTAASTTPSTSGTPAPKALITPILNVEIPGLKFSDPIVTATTIKTSFLADYLNAIYAFLIGAATIMAIVMIMVGGLQYTIGAASSAQVEKGKDRIKNGVTGLILLLCVFLILKTTNPQLVLQKMIELQNVPLVEYPLEDPGDTDDEGGSESGVPVVPGDIYCPKSGGVAVLQKIIESAQGKVVYRFGGKISNNPLKPGQKYSESPTGKNAEFASYCPDGQMCLDCSGYIDFVYRCAGLKAEGWVYGASGMLANTKLLNTKDNPIDFENGIMNGVKLQPGDLFGWTRNDRMYNKRDPAKGLTPHILMFAGIINGKPNQVTESSGCDVKCRLPGNNPKTRPFSALKNYFPVKEPGGVRYYRVKRASGAGE